MWFTLLIVFGIIFILFLKIHTKDIEDTLKDFNKYKISYLRKHHPILFIVLCFILGYMGLCYLLDFIIKGYLFFCN